MHRGDEWERETEIGRMWDTVSIQEVFVAKCGLTGCPGFFAQNGRSLIYSI